MIHERTNGDDARARRPTDRLVAVPSVDASTIGFESFDGWILRLIESIESMRSTRGPVAFERYENASASRSRAGRDRDRDRDGRARHPLTVNDVVASAPPPSSCTRAWRGMAWRARVVIARAGRVARTAHRWTQLHPSVRVSVRPSDDRIDDDDASTIHPSTTSTTTDHRRRRFLAAHVEKIFSRRAIFFVCARRRGAFSFSCVCDLCERARDCAGWCSVRVSIYM